MPKPDIKTTPPSWCPDAVPSRQGWRHPQTGELLVAVKGGCSLPDIIDENTPSQEVIDENVTGGDVLEENLEEKKVLDETEKKETVIKEDVTPKRRKRTKKKV